LLITPMRRGGTSLSDVLGHLDRFRVGSPNEGEGEKGRSEDLFSHKENSSKFKENRLILWPREIAGPIFFGGH